MQQLVGVRLIVLCGTANRHGRHGGTHWHSCHDWLFILFGGGAGEGGGGDDRKYTNQVSSDNARGRYGESTQREHFEHTLALAADAEAAAAAAEGGG